jgi:hypothetical protein
MVHSGSQSHSFRFDRDDRGDYTYRVGSSEPEGLGLPAGWACQSLILGRNAMTDIYYWPAIADLLGDVSTAIVEALADLS